jgi:hypothetical protein
MADNLDPEYLRDLEASLQASREAIDNWTTELLSGKKETELERDKRKSSIQAIAEEKKTREDNIAALKKFGGSVLDTSKQFKDTLLSTEGGMTKYNASLKTASTGLADLVGSIGIFGKTLGVVIKVISFAVETVTQGNEKLIKSYNDLGEIGATSALTTTELLKFAETAGYGTRNLDGLIKPVKSLGTGLIALGGSTGEGIKKFAQLAATTEEQRAAYRRLGLSQEEVTQLQADYVRTTTNSSLTLSKSVEKQRKSADEYIESMVLMSSLTGTTIKQQQEARDKALAQENFNAYLFAKGKQRDEIQTKANAEENVTKKASLQAEADRISAVIKSKTEFGQLAMSTRDGKTAIGMLELAATDNASVYTNNSAAILNSGFGWQRLMDTMNKGGDVYDAYMEETAKAVNKFTKEYGEGAYAYGEASRELQQRFGIDNDARKLSTLYTQRNTEEGKKAYELQKKELADKMKGLGKEDPVLKAENARLEAEKKTREAMDSLYKLIQGPVNNAFTSFFESLLELSDWVAEITGQEFGSEEDRTRRKARKKEKEKQAEIKQLEKDIGFLEARFPEGKEDAIGGPAQKQRSQLTEKRKRLNELASRPASQSGTTSVRSIDNAIDSQPTSAPPASASFGAAGETAGGAANVKVEDVLTFTARSGSKSNFEELESSIKNRVLAAAKEFNDATGKKLIINSAKRDPADQIRLYNETVAAGRPGKGPKGMTVAKPGTSYHERGLAVDIQNYTDNDALVALNKQGLYQTDLQGDPVHFQIPKYGDGGIVDTPQLAWVGDKGREAIVPLSNPDSILAKLLTGSPSEAASMMPNTGSSSVSNEMIEAMIYKFDTMISYLSEGVDIQQKILRQS